MTYNASQGKPAYAAIINRLDRPVSGLVVCFIGTIYAAAGIEKYRSWRENTIFKDEVGVVHVGLRTLINVYFRVRKDLI